MARAAPSLVHEYLGTGAHRPGSHRQGKFVQLRYRGQEHLCFAPRSVAGFHAQIVELFCLAQGLPFRSSPQQDRPAVDPELEVVGGGRYVMDEQGCTLRLEGTSLAYGRFDAAGLRERLAAEPRLAGYTIIIEPP